MTEPKHIPLPTRWSDDFHQLVQDRADALAEAIGWVLDLVPHPIQAAMKAYDDTHDLNGYEMPPPLPTDAELAAEYDRARGYDRPIAVQAAEAREDIKGAPVGHWPRHPIAWCPTCRAHDEQMRAD